MSKTIRRRDNFRPWWLKDDDLWRYRSDSWYSNSVKARVKDHTNKNRRADDRAAIYNLMIDPEYDHIDYEKKYLGIIWIYD
jgi:hypothetical protein